ncbi:PREDICTED: uncharacterized protein LOC104738581 [Camelina sativa]|uniref:Uncharacterized protein LOC104738581 n=1 Tax=Camelina sativa TaxID=90675 RepID=A0ABM0VJ52_CAMSA|nr:PREDICTED: uncharacterized protein LOC104738581 [Camelina sativa]
MGPPTEASQHLKVADLLLPKSKYWNKELIRNILPEYEQMILNLNPSFSGAPDIWAWLPSSDGTYSSKSGYIEAIKKEEPEESTPINTTLDNFNWHKQIWSLKCSPKTKLLLWKIIQNALPVGENLDYRCVNDSLKCPHCEAEESVLHMFYKCPFAKKIWDLAPFEKRLIVEEIATAKSGLESANDLRCLPPSGVGSGPLSPWILWVIWTSRNQLIFNKKRISAEDALITTIIRAREWHDAQPLSATLTKLPMSNKNPRIPQIPPNYVLCCTNASWKEDR